MPKGNINDSRDWNDNQGFLQRLDQRFNEANEAANEGFVIAWYRHLRTIYRIMHNKISKDKDILADEKTPYKWLNIKFENAKNSIQNLSSSYSNRAITQQLQMFSLTDVETTLDEIDTVLCDLYVKYYIRLEAVSQDPSEAVREVFR